MKCAMREYQPRHDVPYKEAWGAQEVEEYEAAQEMNHVCGGCGAVFEPDAPGSLGWRMCLGCNEPYCNNCTCPFEHDDWESML